MLSRPGGQSNFNLTLFTQHVKDVSRCSGVTQTTVLQLKTDAQRSDCWHNYVFSPAEVYTFSSAGTGAVL